MKLTEQQLAFIDEVTHGTGNVCLDAYAGTGKTTTILHAVDSYYAEYPNAEITVCAFNRPVANEVAGKLKAKGYRWQQVNGTTVHSMGLTLARFFFNLPDKCLDVKKVWNIISHERDTSPQSELYWTYGSQISALVKFAKQAGFGFFDDCPIASVDSWARLAYHFDVNGLEDTSKASAVIAAAQHVYQRSLDITDTLDFDDMVLFPLVFNMRVRYQKDLVIVEEAQDLSRARQALIRKHVRRDGKLVIIGDPRQAIYGFSGADEAAMERLVEQLDAKRMPLSVTWRCPRVVVEKVQSIVPGYQAAPNALEGSIETIDELPDDMCADDAILCRNTAPLIDLAYALIRRRVPCRVEGRAIGEGLMRLAQRWKVEDIAGLMERLDDYKEREVQKATAKNDDAKVEAVEDKVGTLVAICEMCLKEGKHRTDDVIEFIDELFEDGAKGVLTLATYHRSKGREWKRVVLFQPWLCPSKYARQEWQKRQEENLRYVAQTRCLERLVFVG